MKNRRTGPIIVAGLVVVGLVVLVALVLVVKSPPSYDISEDYPLSSNLASAVPYGANSLVYSSGQAMMLYDYQTGKTSLLSPAVGVSNAKLDSLSVSPDKKYILFHDPQVVTGGVLYNQLLSANQAASHPYWWVYNVAAQTFRTLPVNTLLAVMEGDNVEALTAAGESESIVTIPASTLSPESPMGIPGSSNFLATSTGFLLQTPNNQILTTTNGLVSKVLASNVVMVGANSNGSEIIAVKGTDNARQLVSIDAADGTQKVIAGGIVGQPVWSASGSVLFATGSPGSTASTMYSYDLSTQKTWQWDFNGPVETLSNSTPLTPVLLVSPQSAIVSSSEDSYYIIGSNIVNPLN
jgi:hypothetical protein